MKVAQSCPTLCDPMDYTVHGILLARILDWVAFPFSRGYPEPRNRTQVSWIAGGFCSNSCPLSQWCHPAISSSVIPLSSCLQSFPTSGSFPMSQFFPTGVQSTGALASASVIQMNIQDWFPLGLTGWISLQSKKLSRDFSNTTVKNHKFFSAQLLL